MLDYVCWGICKLLSAVRILSIILWPGIALNSWFEKIMSNFKDFFSQCLKYAVARSFEPLTVSLFRSDRRAETDDDCWGKELQERRSNRPNPNLTLVSVGWGCKYFLRNWELFFGWQMGWGGSMWAQARAWYSNSWPARMDSQLQPATASYGR